jgi:type II secretory pathway pseudopilin PulG
VEKLENKSSKRRLTLAELVVVLLIVALVTTLAIPVARSAIRSSRRAALVEDARDLYLAFMRYHAKEGSFPGESLPADRAFDRQTLSPLTTEGYFDHAESFTKKLWQDQLMVYVAPDFGGPDTQFFTVFWAKSDPTIRIAVAHTNIVLLDGTDWLDGVYLIEGGRLVPVDEG